jgi:hypothetical protein
MMTSAPSPLGNGHGLALEVRGPEDLIFRQDGHGLGRPIPGDLTRDAQGERVLHDAVHAALEREALDEGREDGGAAILELDLPVARGVRVQVGFQDGLVDGVAGAMLPLKVMVRSP